LGSGETGDHAPQIRTFTGAERQWVAKTAGRALTGANPDGGAPLLHLTFHRAEEQDRPVREIFVVGTTLEDFGDHDLVDLLDRARAYREPEKRQRARNKGRKGGV
jgi:hypothetical protein